MFGEIYKESVARINFAESAYACAALLLSGKIPVTIENFEHVFSITDILTLVPETNLSAARAVFDKQRNFAKAYPDYLSCLEVDWKQRRKANEIFDGLNDISRILAKKSGQESEFESVAKSVSEILTKYEVAAPVLGPERGVKFNAPQLYEGIKMLHELFSYKYLQVIGIDNEKLAERYGELLSCMQTEKVDIYDDNLANRIAAMIYRCASPTGMPLREISDIVSEDKKYENKLMKENKKSKESEGRKTWEATYKKRAMEEVGLTEYETIRAFAASERMIKGHFNPIDLAFNKKDVELARIVEKINNMHSQELSAAINNYNKTVDEYIKPENAQKRLDKLDRTHKEAKKERKFRRSELREKLKIFKEGFTGITGLVTESVKTGDYCALEAVSESFLGKELEQKNVILPGTKKHLRAQAYYLINDLKEKKEKNSGNIW